MYFNFFYPPAYEIGICLGTVIFMFLLVNAYRKKVIFNGMLIFKLCGRRDKFPFFLTKLLPLSSNIPSYIFYSLFYSELLRVS